MAGRGGDEGRRKPPGSGAHEGPVAARKHGAGDRKAAGGAPEGDASVSGRACRKAGTGGRAFWRSTPSHFPREGGGETGKVRRGFSRAETILHTPKITT
jgi:hypothetical protein